MSPDRNRNGRLADADSVPPAGLNPARHGRWFLESQIGSADGRYVGYYRGASPGPVYGEITAYAISVGCIWYRHTGDGRFLERARRCAEYLLGVAHPGVRGVGDQRVFVFDTGIFASGLMDLFEATEDEAYLDQAVIRLNWILAHCTDGSVPAVVPDEGGGAWHLRRSVHLAKVALPLLKGWRANGDARYKNAAAKLLDWALSLQDRDGQFRIAKGVPATMLHPHCYACEAFVYAGWVLGDTALKDVASRAADWLAAAQNPDGSFYKWSPPVGDASGLGRALRALVRTKVSDATAQAIRIWKVLGVHRRSMALAESYLLSLETHGGGLVNHVRQLSGISWRQSRVYAWPTFFWHHALGIPFGDSRAAREIF